MMNPSAVDRRRWLASVGATLALSALGCERSPTAKPADSTGSRDADLRDADLRDAATSGTANQAATEGRWITGPALDRALHWLWSKQSRAADGVPTLSAPTDSQPPLERDGSWKSGTYALLKSGRTLTPFLLHAMQGVKYEALPCGAYWSTAYDFVRRSVRADGSVGGGPDDIVEYPNYSTALALQVLKAAPPDPADAELRARMTKYLVGEQYDEAAGFAESHVAYGAIGFGGDKPRGGSPGHIDIGHTRHVLEALRAAGHDDPATYRRAERFLRLLQKHPTEDRPQPNLNGDVATTTSKPPYDGGFYFSPVVLAANKGGTAAHQGREYFRSYATATCDGILSLLACGVRRDDERITAAMEWLKRHPELDYPGGVPVDTNENWRASIRFYHFAVRAECYAALQWPGAWRKELCSIVAGLQQPDGSFVNCDGALMKEDDPLVCTGLAVIALSRCVAN